MSCIQTQAVAPVDTSGLADTIAQLQQQLDQQRASSHEQIKQSEQNLTEHFKNLSQQQQVSEGSKVI